MTEQQAQINLALSMDDVNLILASLGNMPFKDVAHLIAAIKADGDRQLAVIAATAKAAEQPTTALQ